MTIARPYGAFGVQRKIVSMETNDDHLDWIPSAEAARLCRSPRGRRTHCSTIIRWILSGKLEGRRRGRYWYCRRSAVLALLKPVKPPEPPKGLPAPGSQRAAMDRWADGVLREVGMRR